MKKRLGIFVFYDPQGIVDNYVIYLLKNMATVLSELVIVSNIELEEKEKRKFSLFSEQIYVRENQGYDGGAYKDIFLNYCLRDKVLLFDEVVLFNDTFYGFFYPVENIFEEMEQKKNDMWSLSEHEKFYACGKEYPWHLQSYFLVINRNIISSEIFWLFWNQFVYPKNFEEAVENFEIKFSTIMKNAGFILQPYCRIPEYINDDIAYNYDYVQQNIFEMICCYGFPILKRKSVFRTKGIENRIMNIMSYLEKKCNYDISYIWENILRLYQLDMLEDSFSLYFPIDEDKSQRWELWEKDVAMALLIHSIENLKMYMKYLQDLQGIDIYFMICNKNITSDILHKMENGKGRFYIIGNESEFDEGMIFCRLKNVWERYKYVCVLYDTYDTRNTFQFIKDIDRDNTWENLFPSVEYAKQVISLFEKNKNLGLLFPPRINKGIAAQNEADSFIADDIQINKYNQFCKKNHLKILLKSGNRVITGKKSFWCRGKLLSELGLEENVKFDADDWKTYIQLLPYIAQNKFYYIGYLLNKKYENRYISSIQEKKYECEHDLIKCNTINNLLKKYIERNSIRIYIYGNGMVARKLYDDLEENGIALDGTIISENQIKRNEFGMNSFFLSEYELIKKDTDIVIIGVGHKLRSEIEILLDQREINYI